jgi:hypothetical protein
MSTISHLRRLHNVATLIYPKIAEVSVDMYSAVISTIGLDRLLLLQLMLLMIGAKTPAGSDDWDRPDQSVLSLPLA